MRLTRRELLGGLLASPVLFLAGRTEAEARSRRRQPTRILCIGNSLTAGSVAGGGACYVEVLGLMLGRHFEIINAGGGGTSVLDWLRPPILDWPPPLGGAYEILAEEHMPCGTVVVELGGNDAVGFWEARPTSVDDYLEGMVGLMWRLQREGARRILLLTPIPNPGASMQAQGRLLSYRLTLIAQRWPRGVSVVDVYRLLDPEEDFEGLNCHPNERGHRKIALAVVRRLRRRQGWWLREVVSGASAGW